MVTINKVYTKNGDKGQTSLGNGEKRPKNDLRIEAYGTVDEANSHLGVVACYCPKPVQELIFCIQNDLFDLGADLCRPHDHTSSDKDIRIDEDQILQLERAIDQLNADLPPLKSFILPGGSVLSSHLHVARTVVRRAERLVVGLAEYEKVNPEAIKYLNRLSDLLFVLSRQSNYINPKVKDPELLWQPKKN